MRKDVCQVQLYGSILNRKVNFQQNNHLTYSWFPKKIVVDNTVHKTLFIQITEDSRDGWHSNMYVKGMTRGEKVKGMACIDAHIRKLYMSPNWLVVNIREKNFKSEMCYNLDIKFFKKIYLCLIKRLRHFFLAILNKYLNIFKE